MRLFFPLTSPTDFLQVSPAVIEVMDEQAGSPGANTENNGQRNGDEVRAEHADIKLLIFHFFQFKLQECPASVHHGGLLPEPSKHICFCYLCRSLDVAAGPRGGRGRSQ